MKKQKGIRNPQGHSEPPAPAKRPCVDMVVAMENLVTNAPTVPLRVWAGFHAVYAHGCLRASDLIRSQKMRLTADALCGLAVMKKRHVLSPFAALLN